MNTPDKKARLILKNKQFQLSAYQINFLKTVATGKALTIDQLRLFANIDLHYNKGIIGRIHKAVQDWEEYNGVEIDGKH